MIRKIFILIFLLALYAPAVDAVTRYADGNISPASCTNYIITGTGARTCASPGTALAYKTIQAGVTAMVAGDILLVRSGTYTSTYDTSIALYIATRSGLSNSARLTIQNYPGETFIIQPPGARDYIIYSDASFVTLRGDNGGGNLHFVLDGVNQPKDTGNTGIEGFVNDGNGISLTHDLTIIGLEIKGVPYTSIISGHNSIIQNNYIHNNKNDVSSLPAQWSQGIYSNGTNNRIEGNTIDTIPGGFAIIVCPSVSPDCSSTTIKNNIVRNSLLGMGLYNMGTGSAVYNNLVYNVGHGINVTQGAGGALKVYSNTVYNASGNASALATYYSNRQNDCLAISASNSGLDVKNNIFFTCANATVANSSTGVTFATNYCTSGCTGTGTINSSTDPFVTIGSDFHLKAASTAVNAGTDLGSSYATDYAGLPRPQGAGWDIGAYEYQGAVVTVAITLPAGCTGTTTACTTSNSQITLTGTSSLP